MVSPIFHLKNIPPRKLSALKRKAERLGMTMEKYVRELIENDLAMDRKAQNTSFDELAAPFRKTMRAVSEKDIDHAVDAARGSRRSKQKR